MKKFVKFACAAACALCLCASITACTNGGTTSHTGEYSYETAYGTYGVKVNVVLRGNVIDRVEILDSDYLRVTPDWDGNTVYTNGEQTLLASFAGKSVAQVKGYSVTKRQDGTPTLVSASGLSVITGATQSTGRMVLAVQNALKDVEP